MIHWTELNSWARSDDYKTPLVLYGASEDELEEASQRLLATMWCEKSGDTPCDQCSLCDSVNSGVHPDMLLNRTEENSWSIKEVRGWQNKLAHRPLSGRLGVVIIQAEKLTGPAAAALLKTLEELGQGAGIVLTTRWPGRLLATIRSRCQMINLGLTEIESEGTAKMWDSEQLLKRINKGEELTDQELALIERHIKKQLVAEGPSSALRVSCAMLRDYYRIAAKTGNKKAAKDVLLTSLWN